MIYYVEEKDFAGRWCPKLYHGELPEKQRFRAAPIVVPAGATLDELQAVYGDG